MNLQKLKHNYLPISLILIAIYSVIGYVQEKTGLPVTNTTFWWIIQVGVLLLFISAKQHFVSKNQAKTMLFVKCYLLWNAFNIVRGFFIAETYWDWKGLVGNAMGLSIPIVAYTATHSLILQKILQKYIRYGLPLFVVIVFFITTDSYGFYLVPISFLLLFIPIIRTPWKWIVLGIGVFVIFADFGARSNVIKFGLPIVLSLIYYFRFFLSVSFFEVIRKLLFVAPIILFVLAVSGLFNIFNMDEYIEGDHTEIKRDDKGQVVEDKLTADTRTFLYVEVLQTAQVYDSWIIGRSPARGNKSDWFGEDDMNNRGERLTNEVAILNVFTWTGLVGVVLYLLVFYKASYLAINRSNNIFSKILGLFIAFRWMYAWVEDINSFSLTTFFLWIMIGMCFSKSFRSMSNKQFIFWVRGIFEKKKQVPRRIKFNPNFNPNI